MLSEAIQPTDAVRTRSGAAAVMCAHCSLPVPSGLVDADAEQQFCCNGCRTVYEVIHASGLDGYYKLRDRFADKPQRAASGRRRYEALDSPAFRSLYIREDAGGMCAVDLQLEGVHCPACVWLIEKLPTILDGVLETRLEMRRGIVHVRWDDRVVRLSAIASKLGSLGYPAHPASGVRQRDIHRREDRRMMVRIAVAGAIAGNVMAIAFALYGGMLHGIADEHAALFRWVSLVLTFLCLAWPGRVFFRGAIAALRTGSLHMDLPVALGLGVGAIWGAANTIRGVGDVYFESVTAIVFLLLIGRWIQQRQRRRAADAVEALFALTPATARVIEDGVAQEKPIESITPGCTIEALAGETIPIDGAVIQGESTINRALLTGESAPISVGVGDRVEAGAINVEAALTICAEAAGQDTRVGRLMALMERCANERAPIVRMADRLAGFFVAAVLALAAMTAALWLFLDRGQAVNNVSALLIVTCPCALGIATPLAVVVAIGRAARRGILIKGGDALESLHRPGVVILDKTGTITAGMQQIAWWRGEESAKPLARALESESAHPIARAFCLEFDDTGLRATEVKHAVGSGVEGLVDGQCVRVGSPAFVRMIATTEPSWVAEAIAEAASSAQTPVLIAMEGRIVAVAAFGDPVRTDTASAIDQLRRFGWSVLIASGDHPQVVSAVAREVGLDEHSCFGAMSPEDKLALVGTHAAAGTVVMVGDGVNDAAALAAATVGVAVQGGAEASLAAADVYLSNPGLSPLVELIEGSNRTVGVIRRNFTVSILYNVISAAMAIAGIINPLIAAILMPLSSFSVVTLSYRCRTFGEK